MFRATVPAATVVNNLEIQFFCQVMNRVGKIANFVINRARVLESRPHTPTQFFWESPTPLSPAPFLGFSENQFLVNRQDDYAHLSQVL